MDIRCFHCGGRVIRGNDFTFEDYCMEGDGIVHSCSCSKCGARIEYYVPLDPPEETEPDKQMTMSDLVRQDPEAVKEY